MKIRLAILLSFVFFCACQNERKAPETKVSLPNTPAEVAQQWVEAFYNDDYPKAELLGTDFTRMMIDSTRKEMIPDVQVIAFKIYNMSCETAGDSAFCTYVYQEEGYDYDEYVNLVKQKGQWLVDASWDNSSDGDIEFEELIDEFEKIIEQESKE